MTYKRKQTLSAQIDPKISDNLDELVKHYNQISKEYIPIPKYAIVEKIIQEHYERVFQNKNV
jgi:hypothetical protein